MLGRDAVPAGVMPHTSSPRAALGATSPGALRLRAGPTAVGGESRMSRGGAPVGETHPVTCAGPVGHGSSPEENLRADLRAIQVTRHLGAPYPSLWGTGKETGHPSPRKNRGRRSVGFSKVQSEHGRRLRLTHRGDIGSHLSAG